MQRLGDRAPVAKELPIESGGALLDRAAIIDVPWCHMQGQQFALVIDDQMQCEAVEPPHGGLAPRRHARKDCVCGNAVVVTDGQRRRVDEGNACAAPLARGAITTQGYQRAGGVRQNEESSPGQGKKDANGPPHTPWSNA